MDGFGRQLFHFHRRYKALEVKAQDWPPVNQKLPFGFSSLEVVVPYDQ